MSKVRLGDVGEIITGNTPKTSDVNNYLSNDICFVKPSDLSESRITEVKETEFYISEYAREKARILPVGSVLVSCIGIIGKVGVTKKECAFNQQINAIIPDLSICMPEYLAYVIQYHKGDMQAIANAPVVPILNKTQFSDITISIAPLEDQQYVMKRLNVVTDLTDKHNLQLQKLDELVKARFVEMFGDSETNPYNYSVSPLKDISEYFNGLTYKPENVSETGTIVLRSSNIQNSQLDFEDTVRVDCSIRDKLFVKENDILMCSRNGSAKLVGKVALIKNTKERMSFGAFMMIIRSKYYSYLMTYFQTDAFRRQIKTGATTTINQITGKMLDDVVLPVPNITSVDKFTEFCTKVEKQKMQIHKSLEKLEMLKKALMQRYFG